METTDKPKEEAIFRFLASLVFAIWATAIAYHGEPGIGAVFGVVALLFFIGGLVIS